MIGLPYKRVIALKDIVKNTSEAGLPLRPRLFAFLMLMVLIMFLGVMAILLLTGTLTSGVDENKQLIAAELSRISEDIENDFGDISVQAITLSERLSESIEKELSLYNIHASELDKHPEILEHVLSTQCEKLLFALEKSKSSGAFVILNATVNPKLINSANSRAGLYFKNMEPNILSASTPNIILLRGFPNIARENSLNLHSQWTMEFNITKADYFKGLMNTAQNTALPLSRLYYWTNSMVIQNTSEDVILCTIPLIASDKTVIGVCGFEISGMLFKLSYSVRNTKFPRMFSMLSPMFENMLVPSKSLFAGVYKTNGSELSEQVMEITEAKVFNLYRQNDGTEFIGLHRQIKLYPQDSAYKDLNPILAVIIPKSDMDWAIKKLNSTLLYLCILLVLLGIVISLFISKKYIKPVLHGIEVIKTNKYNEQFKVKIPEIDDLIEFLSIGNEKQEAESTQELPYDVYEEFTMNVKSLSPAERAVFDLYVKGHTAKEITEILCLSINTIKSHNKKIYMKMNVASRKELLTFVNMLRKAGKEI